jgi:hypothetical protein
MEYIAIISVFLLLLKTTSLFVLFSYYILIPWELPLLRDRHHHGGAIMRFAFFVVWGAEAQMIFLTPPEGLWKPTELKLDCAV